MPQPYTQMMIRLKPELADRIQLEAQDRGVSMNGLIAQVLDKQIGQLKVTS